MCICRRTWGRVCFTLNIPSTHVYIYFQLILSPRALFSGRLLSSLSLPSCTLVRCHVYRKVDLCLFLLLYFIFLLFPRSLAVTNSLSALYWLWHSTFNPGSPRVLNLLYLPSHNAHSKQNKTNSKPRYQLIFSDKFYSSVPTIEFYMNRQWHIFKYCPYAIYLITLAEFSYSWGCTIRYQN